MDPVTSKSSSRGSAAAKIPAKAGYHHGSLRSALIDAAVALLDEHGPNGFTLVQAARLAGVSVAAPYRHFESKEALLAAVAEQGFQQLRTTLETVRAEDHNDPLDRLIALGVSYVEFGRTHPQVFKLMFSVRDRLSTSEAGRAALATLAAVLAEIDETGGLTTDLSTATRATWASAHGLAILHIDGMATFAHDDPEMIDTTLRTLLHGIAQPPRQRRRR